jgi:AraC-like DNA-binding protein
MSFGLLMAESRSIESIGAVSLLLKHQPNARSVLDAIIRYQSLMAEPLAACFEEAGETTLIRIDLVAGLGRRQAIEHIMGMLCGVLSGLTSGRWRPESVHFTHSAPTDLSVHRRVFQCPLIFDSEFNGFCCSSASLDAPNPAAESVMARHAQRYLDMLVPDPTDGSVTEAARRSIYLLLPAGRATLEQTATNLGLHPRALQRTLEKEGKSFAILLNEARRELALRYLSNAAHSVTAVGQMSGYASPSSFTRWFAAEFGMAPAHWRAEERQEAAQTPRQAELSLHA